MVSSEHFGGNWMTRTMLTTWPFFRTLGIRYRKRPALLQTPQYVRALRSIRGRVKSWWSTRSPIPPLCKKGEALDEVKSITYLGSIVDNFGGQMDIRVHIGSYRARVVFQQLKNAWRSSLFGTSTKFRILNTIVKPLLLYGAETWRTTVATMKRIQTFINTCLRKILKIRLPDIIRKLSKICGNERDSSLQKLTSFKHVGSGSVTPFKSLHLTS